MTPDGGRLQIRIEVFTCILKYNIFIVIFIFIYEFIFILSCILLDNLII